jgi:farnesyl-diphosphate farnesyltransferase
MNLSLSLEETYQNTLLQGVSRTFALTIPQLPPRLATVVGNAYLLCRIADTIEDEPSLSTAQKVQFSQNFTEVVTGAADVQAFSRALSPLLSSSTSAQEHELIVNTARVIALTQQFNPAQRDALSDCVRIMAQGMAAFQQQASLAGLANLSEMNRYCYYVAGVVGEMLTRLFCEYSPAIARHETQLQKLALSFGQGLQMTNILKDIWEDRSRHACWLPRDIFAAHGVDLENLSLGAGDSGFNQALAELIAVAHSHLALALNYVLLIPKSEQGIRRFCLWALGMAMLTLRKIYHSPDFSTGQQVKISRRSVRWTILLSNVAAHHDRSLQFLFYLLGRGLPKTVTVDVQSFAQEFSGMGFSKLTTD